MNHFEKKVMRSRSAFLLGIDLDSRGHYINVQLNTWVKNEERKMSAKLMMRCKIDNFLASNQNVALLGVAKAINKQFAASTIEAKQSKFSLILNEGKRDLSLRHKLANSITTIFIMGFRRICATLRPKATFLVPAWTFLSFVSKIIRNRLNHSPEIQYNFHSDTTRLGVLILMLFHVSTPKEWNFGLLSQGNVLICFFGSHCPCRVEIKEWLKERKTNECLGEGKRTRRNNNKYKERFLFLLSQSSHAAWQQATKSLWRNLHNGYARSFDVCSHFVGHSDGFSHMFLGMFKVSENFHSRIFFFCNIC